MAISIKLRQEIKEYLGRQLDRKLRTYRPDGESKPFLEALVSSPTAKEASFIHSLYTLIGGKTAEKIIEKICLNNFETVIPQKPISGVINSKTSDTIRQILRDLGKRTIETGKRYPDTIKETKEILTTIDRNGESENDLIDLYLKNKNIEYFIEIKSVKPNKRGSRDVKRDILRFRAISGKNLDLLKIYVGMIYNPYWPNEYRWWPPLNYLDRESELLVGEDFWNFIGGKNTYNDLLKVVRLVSNEYKPKILSKIEEIRNMAQKSENIISDKIKEI